MLIVCQEIYLNEMKTTRFVFYAAFRTLVVDTVKMIDTIGKDHILLSLLGFMFDLEAD